MDGGGWEWRWVVDGGGRDSLPSRPGLLGEPLAFGRGEAWAELPWILGGVGCSSRPVRLHSGSGCVMRDRIPRRPAGPHRLWPLPGHRAVYRMCFRDGVFFFLFSLLMICVRSSRDPRAAIQNGEEGAPPAP